MRDDSLGGLNQLNPVFTYLTNIKKKKKKKKKRKESKKGKRRQKQNKTKQNKTKEKKRKEKKKKKQKQFQNFHLFDVSRYLYKNNLFDKALAEKQSAVDIWNQVRREGQIGIEEGRKQNNIN